MAPMYLGFLGVIADGEQAAPFVLPFVALVAAGIVSRIPTFSGKGTGQQIRREQALPIVVTTVFAMIVLITYPWEMLTFLSAGYVAMIPFGIRSYARQDRAWKAELAAAKD